MRGEEGRGGEGREEERRGRDDHPFLFITCSSFSLVLLFHPFLFLTRSSSSPVPPPHLFLLIRSVKTENLDPSCPPTHLVPPSTPLAHKAAGGGEAHSHALERS